MICRKQFFLAGLTLCINLHVYCQTVTSAKSGDWNDPTTWSGGVIPTIENTSLIIVRHEISVKGTASIQVDNLDVQAPLTIGSGATLEVYAKEGSDDPDVSLTGAGELRVYGTLTGRDSALFSGTSGGNTFFEAGSVYRHLSGSRGFIPYATWHPQSVFRIEGFRGSGYIAIAYSDSWKQHFGTVIYDCPVQTSFVDLNGYLRNISGDFIIEHTNAQALRLSTTQDPVIQVGGSFIVEGPSEVWMSTLGDSATMYIGGDFLYHSTSTGPSYLNTRGISRIIINGRMEVDTEGSLRFASGSADSTGVRRTTVDLRDGLSVTHGSLTVPDQARGVVTFSGPKRQRVNCIQGAFNGNFNFLVNEESTIDLGTSILSCAAGTLSVKGTLAVGSTAAEGAIQNTDKGNVQLGGIRTYYDNATIEYNGLGPQFIGSGHPQSPGVNLLCNNPTSIELLQPLLLHDLTLKQGEINFNDNLISVQGDISREPGTSLIALPSILLTGNEFQSVSLQDLVLKDMLVDKSGGSIVNLLSGLQLSGVLQIQSEGTVFNSNGHLTLRSTNDEASGTAVVAALPSGSSISGDVTVQRHMQGEGRLYRYISSAVTNATVASMMDDFPVTGTFEDPSSGKGIISRNPSLFFYDESTGSLQQGWRPYPVRGMAQENLLQIGRGYAAFIRESLNSTIWDVTGILNQGSIALPIQYSGGGNEESQGWNLVGNPYAAAIDWDVASGWSRSASISPVIAVRDNGSGTFRYWDGEVGELENGIIATGQSFWVRATGGGASLVIHEDAKVIPNGNFYRSNQSYRSPDFMRITIEGRGIGDNVFLRLKKGAAPEYDLFDASKFKNDHLSLSLLSSDHRKLAIYAVEQMACEQEYQLWVAFSTNEDGSFVRSRFGAYTISLEAFGVFAHADVTIVDNFTGTSAVLRKSDPYTFELFDEPAAYAPDRFSLIIRAVTPGDSATVDAPEFVCDATAYHLQIHRAKKRIDYVPVLNGIEIGSAVNRIGDTLQLTVAHEWFKHKTENQLKLEARSTCSTRLIDSVMVRVSVPGEVTVHAQQRCPSGQASVVVSGGEADGFYYWYESQDDFSPVIQQDSIFTIPPLNENTLYYVSAVTSSGCVGPRRVVEAQIIQFHEASIRMEDGYLWSNYETGNQWFHNGQLLLGDTLQMLLPSDEGLYQLQVSLNGCVSIAAFNILNTLPLEEQEGQAFTVTPNPFRDRLLLRRTSSVPWTVRLISIYGRTLLSSLHQEKEIILNTEKLNNGLYVLEIEENGRYYQFKMLKQ